MIGSMRVARQAGIQQATAAVAATSATAMPITAGSSASKPASQWRRTRATTTAQQTDRDAEAGQPHPLPENQGADLARRGAQRHPYPNFLRAPRRHIRHHAIHPGRGK